MHEFGGCAQALPVEAQPARDTAAKLFRFGYGMEKYTPDNMAVKTFIGSCTRRGNRRSAALMMIIRQHSYCHVYITMILDELKSGLPDLSLLKSPTRASPSWVSKIINVIDFKT
jgi:hypothetical protein